MKMDKDQLKRHIHKSDLTAMEKRYLEGLVDAPPVIHARWEKVGEFGSEYRCTNCGLIISMNGSARTPDELGWHHCKRCGARMDKEE